MSVVWVVIALWRINIATVMNFIVWFVIKLKDYAVVAVNCFVAVYVTHYEECICDHVLPININLSNNANTDYNLSLCPCCRESAVL